MLSSLGRMEALIACRITFFKERDILFTIGPHVKK